MATRQYNVMSGFGPALIQQDPRLQRGARLAEAMLAQSMQPRRIDHPLQGFAQLAQALSGRIQQQRVDDQIEQRRQAMSDTARKALMASGDPHLAMAMGGGDLAMGVDVPAQSIGGPQGLIAALAGNPDTAPLALSFGVQRAFAEPKKREIIKGADGRNYYIDTGEPVLPNVKVPEDLTSLQKEYQQAVNQGFDGSILDYQTAKAEAGRPSTVVNNQIDLSAGQEATDKEAGKAVNELIFQGGSADIEKNIEQLREARDALASGKNLTGSFLGFLPRSVRAVINPDSIDVQEMVEEVAQRNLRQVLGAQFAQKEGEQLISRAYNPRLDEAINRERVSRLLASMEKGYAAKRAAADYFLKNNGSMDGYEGPRPFDSVEAIAKDAGLTAEDLASEDSKAGRGGDEDILPPLPPGFRIVP